MQNLQVFKTIEIGKIPKDWKFLHLNEIVKINPESIERDYPYSEIEYIDIGSIENYEIKKYEHFNLFERPSRAQRIVRQNDIIVSTVRPYLHGFAKIKHSKPNLVCSTGFAVLRSNNPDDVDFMFNFIMSEYFESQLNRHMTGLAYPAVTSKIVGDTIVGYPKNNREVKKIGNILSKVDELIQKTDQDIEQTQRLKKGLMQTLLTKGIGHTKFKKTELGDIPEEWVVSSIGTKCKLGTGGTPSRSNPKYFKGEIPWVKTTEINFNKINSTEEHITKKALEESSAKVYPKGSLLMAMYGQGITRGRTAILEIDAAINQACAAIQSLGEISIPFLFYWCQYNYEKIRSISQGTHQSNLNLEYVANIKIPLPSMSEQAKVVSILLNIDSLLENQKSNRINVEYLRGGLMQQLLTGKIRVKI